MTTYHPYGASSYTHPETGTALGDYLVSGIPIVRNAVKNVDANALVVNETTGTEKIRLIELGIADSVILPRAINANHARVLRNELASDLLGDLDLVRSIEHGIPEGYQIRSIIPSSELLVGMTIKATLFVSIEKIGKAVKPLTAEQLERRQARQERKLANEIQKTASRIARMEKVETIDSDGNTLRIRSLTQLEAEEQSRKVIELERAELSNYAHKNELDTVLVEKLELELQGLANDRQLALARIAYRKTKIEELGL